MNLNFGDTEQEEWGQRPSRRGFYTIGLVAGLMIGWLLYARFFAPPPRRPVAEAALRLTNAAPRPIQPPIELQQRQVPPRPKPQPETQPQARPQAAPVRPKEESEEQKMRRKMRLLAHYSRPTAVGAGMDGRRLTQQQHVQPTSPTQVDDTDLPHEPVPHRQVLEVPSVVGNNNGNRYRTASVDTPGSVWTNAFYRRGSGHAGVLQQPPSPFVIRRGWKIPARLDDPINTDTPGQITATVVHDIKDSVTGRYTLIPAGSQLVGAYDTRVLYGQQRVPTAWDQINFPNGTFMSLAAMPGADQTGVAGIPATVNNHLWSTASRALLLTITGAGSSLALRSGVTGGFNYGLDDALRLEGGRELGRESRRVFERGYNRPPTLTAKSGDIFLVQVTQNLVFPGPYEDGEQYGMVD